MRKLVTNESRPENIEGKTGRFISTDSEFDGDGIEFKKMIFCLVS